VTLSHLSKYTLFTDGQLWAKASMPASVTLPHRSKYIVVNDVQFFATASTLTSVTMPQLDAHIRDIAATAQNDMRP
jgi:hypothetical protein